MDLSRLSKSVSDFYGAEIILEECVAVNSIHCISFMLRKWCY